MPHHPPARWPYASQTHCAVLAGLTALIANYSPATAQTDVFSSVTEVDLPIAPGAQEPSLFALDDGRILMSWTEPAGNGFAVKTAVGNRNGWSEPQTAVRSDRLFVNWADFPSVAAFGDGTFAIHWLMENGPSPYDYDLNIALSSDAGRTWGDVIVPHRDGTQRQHGFATLLPMTQNRLMAVWLDGRAYDIDATGAEKTAFTNAAQLRVAMIGADGSLSDDTLLDARACTCCQTSGVVTENGTALLVYRDRTAAEIRDISLLRLVDGIWLGPTAIHADGWEIGGCPINGPAIDAKNEQAVVAWFTAADDIPMVNVAFSDDAGESFGDAIRIDNGDPAGRVDVVMLNDGSAVVSWLEWTDTGSAFLVCRARPDIGCRKWQEITPGNEAEAINFPRMARVGEGVYIAWTQPLTGPLAAQDHDVTIRMVFATF